MRLTAAIKIQLVLFTLIALIAIGVMGLHFMRLPATLFGVGRYTVTVELPQTAGLYGGANVTYRGTEVGRVESVGLTGAGVQAVLSLYSGRDIPADLEAEVHSQSAIGEQYLALLPRRDSRPLRDGDHIPMTDTSVPPDINSLLTAANAGLQAIPRESLHTLIDESYTAVGGLGPELSQIVRGTSDLAIDAEANLDALVTLIDDAPAVFDSQSRTSDAIEAWASHTAAVTSQVRDRDAEVGTLLTEAGPAVDEVRRLVEHLQPTLPVMMANLVSVGDVALVYQDNIEQLLVLLPQAVAAGQAGIMANMDTKQDYRGQYLSFNLNINLPPACTTGFIPAQQQRVPTYEDAPERPPGDLYCRVPQDSQFNVRGARNIPCETVPGKRAPTVWLCESDESYVPLNDGLNWKGDPNATLSGQDIPHVPPDAPPLPVAEYDPVTGSYVGPDGRTYTRPDLAQNAPEQTWQTMLLPPGS